MRLFLQYLEESPAPEFGVVPEASPNFPKLQPQPCSRPRHLWNWDSLSSERPQMQYFTISSCPRARSASRWKSLPQSPSIFLSLAVSLIAIDCRRCFFMQAGGKVILIPVNELFCGPSQSRRCREEAAAMFTWLATEIPPRELCATEGLCEAKSHFCCLMQNRSGCCGFGQDENQLHLPLVLKRERRKLEQSRFNF